MNIVARSISVVEQSTSPAAVQGNLCGVVICSYCDKVIRDAPELKEGAVSHGVCDDCREEKLNEFLTEFAKGKSNVCDREGH